MIIVNVTVFTSLIVIFALLSKPINNQLFFSFKTFKEDKLSKNNKIERSRPPDETLATV